jgi:electron transport complex protein RnfC
MNAIIQFTKKLFQSETANEVFKFHGGVHPPEHKSESTKFPITKLTMPSKLTLPLRQHVGNLPKLRVQVGEHVLKGQLLAEAEGSVSAAIHAPTSGTIAAIDEQVIPHPSGLKDHCITLTPDGLDTWTSLQPTDWRNTPKLDLVKKLRDSGIVGLGGATFPTHIKLRSDGKSNVETLVINAAECEPYITCDDMLMRERAEEIARGIEIVQFILGAHQSVIGIEDNKPEAAEAMQKACAAFGTQVKTVPTLYPSGDARRLVHLLLGIEIPHDKRSTEVGIQVFNVATVLAVYRYFTFGEPSISRIVTMTGAVQTPQNFEVLFGTPLSELVQAAGGAHKETTHFIMGGPMMGFDLPRTDVPISKATNCIIASTPNLFAPPPPAMPCIRCARCADACPVNLQPQELYWFAKSDNFEKARDYQLFDCIECGCCSYVCPSNIPLVQYYRYAKSEIIEADKAKEAADLARERNEFKLARIEREKFERTQKHAERAEAGKAQAEKAATTEESAKPAANEDAKKAAIAAAIARAKAQKEAQASAGETPKNTENIQANVQKEIEEIDARRAAVGLDKTMTSDTAIPNADAEKQAKIAAAIAKAKAAKAQAEANKSDVVSDSAPLEKSQADQEKQAKIAQAIAKAKAAKVAADAAKKESGEKDNPKD